MYVRLAVCVFVPGNLLNYWTNFDGTNIGRLLILLLVTYATFLALTRDVARDYNNKRGLQLVQYKTCNWNSESMILLPQTFLEI